MVGESGSEQEDPDQQVTECFEPEFHRQKQTGAEPLQAAHTVWSNNTF